MGREQWSHWSLPSSSGLWLLALGSQSPVRLQASPCLLDPRAPCCLSPGAEHSRSRILSTGTGAWGAGRPKAGGGGTAGSSTRLGGRLRTLVLKGDAHSLPAFAGSPARPLEGLQACLAAQGPYVVGDDGYCISGSARPSSRPSEHLWLLELVCHGWLTVFTCRSWGAVADANLCRPWNPGGTQPPSQHRPGLPVPPPTVLRPRVSGVTLPGPWQMDALFNSQRTRDAQLCSPSPQDLRQPWEEAGRWGMWSQRRQLRVPRGTILSLTVLLKSAAGFPSVTDLSATTRWQSAFALLGCFYSRRVLRKAPWSCQAWAAPDGEPVGTVSLRRAALNPGAHTSLRITLEATSCLPPPHHPAAQNPGGSSESCWHV